MGSSSLDQLLSTVEYAVGAAHNFPDRAAEFLDQALTSVDAALEDHPDNPRALYHKMNVLFQMGNNQGALETADHYLILPDLSMEQRFIGLTNKGYALLGLQQYSLALETYQETLGLFPSYGDQTLARLSVSMARCYMGMVNSADSPEQRKKVIKEAMTHFSKAVKLDPNDPKLFKYKAEAHLSLTQPGQAIADLDRAAELDPVDPMIFVRRANAYDVARRLPPVIHDPALRKKYQFHAKQDYNRAMAIIGSSSSPTNPIYQGVEQMVTLGLQALSRS